MSALISRLREKLEFCEKQNDIKGQEVALQLLEQAAPFTVDFGQNENVLSDCFSFGAQIENARLQPLLKKLIDCVSALEHGEPDYNSAWSMICLMAEGEGDDARVYQQMAKAIHAKLKPALRALESVVAKND